MDRQPIRILIATVTLTLASVAGVVLCCRPAVAQHQPPIGEKTIRFNVSSRMTFLNAGTPTPVDFPTVSCSYDFDIGAPDSDGIVPFRLIASRSKCDPAVFAGPPSLTICAKPKADGVGMICCNPNGCPSLGSPSYVASVNHDSSGTRPGFLLEAGRSADPNCVENTDVVVAGKCATGGANCGRDVDCGNNGPCTGTIKLDQSRACEEHQPCNAANVGLAAQGLNPFAAAHQALSAPICNSSILLTPGNDSFQVGDIVMGYPLQAIVHSKASENGNGGLDDVKNNITGAPGPDGLPDGYGPDGLPCTDDDTTLPLSTFFEGPTTEGARLFIYNPNLYDPHNLPNPNPPFEGIAPAGGATPPHGTIPADACAQLSLGDLTGYRLVSTIPLIDTNVAGDMIFVKHYDGLAPAP